MRIGLIADTQGSFDVVALIKFVAVEFKRVDEIWHAGDWGQQAVLDGLATIGIPLVVVNGNAPEDSRYPMTIERTIGRMRVGMIHNLEPSRKAWTREFDVVIHGHTHRWRDEVLDGVRFINPGTATKPQFGGTERTMARLNFGKELKVEKINVPKFRRLSGI